MEIEPKFDIRQGDPEPGCVFEVPEKAERFPGNCTMAVIAPRLHGQMGSGRGPLWQGPLSEVTAELCQRLWKENGLSRGDRLYVFPYNHEYSFLVARGEDHEHVAARIAGHHAWEKMELQKRISELQVRLDELEAGHE